MHQIFDNLLYIYVYLYLARLTDIVPFFDEMFTGRCVSFLTSQRGTFGVRSSMTVPSLGIAPIRFSAIQVGLKSRLSPGFPFGRSWDW
jgi:hypothetical protein